MTLKLRVGDRVRLICSLGKSSFSQTGHKPIFPRLCLNVPLKSCDAAGQRFFEDALPSIRGALDLRNPLTSVQAGEIILLKSEMGGTKPGQVINDLLEP